MKTNFKNLFTLPYKFVKLIIFIALAIAIAGYIHELIYDPVMDYSFKKYFLDFIMCIIFYGGLFFFMLFITSTIAVAIKRLIAFVFKRLFYSK